MVSRVFCYTTFCFFLACFFISCYFLGKLFFPFLSIILLAIIITGIFLPIYKIICKKLKFIDVFSSLLTCLIIFLILFLPMAILTSFFIKEVLDLVELARSSSFITQKLTGTDLLKKTYDFLYNFNFVISKEELNIIFSRLGKTMGLFLYDQVRMIASNTFSLVINAFLMLLVIFFLLIDGDKLIKFVVDLSPLPIEQNKKLIGKFRDMAGALLFGNGLCGIIQGFFGGLIFWCLNIQSALLWGIVMAFLAFLPIIGIGIILLPTVFFLFLKGRTISSLLLLVFYVLLSIGTEYLLKPKIIGSRLKMHTLMVFFSFLGGLKMFGILGIIYGPLISTAFLTFTDIYLANYRDPKLLK